MATIKTRKKTFSQINRNGDIELTHSSKTFDKNKKYSIPPHYLSLGLYLVIPLLLGIFLGRYLDKRFNTGATFTLSLIVFGTISVFYNLYKLYKEDATAHKHKR